MSKKIAIVLRLDDDVDLNNHPLLYTEAIMYIGGEITYVSSLYPDEESKSIRTELLRLLNDTGKMNDHS